MVGYQYATQVFIMVTMIICYIFLLTEELNSKNKWENILFTTGISIISLLLLYMAGTFSLILGVPYEN